MREELLGNSRLRDRSVVWPVRTRVASDGQVVSDGPFAGSHGDLAHLVGSFALWSPLVLPSPHTLGPQPHSRFSDSIFLFQDSGPNKVSCFLQF